MAKKECKLYIPLTKMKHSILPQYRAISRRVAFLSSNAKYILQINMITIYKDMDDEREREIKITKWTKGNLSYVL